MVAVREELLEVRKRLKRLSARLRKDGHEIAADMPLGAMIEVPAAAVCVEHFIDLVDFLSVGTNDLVQYLLAADRNNDALGELCSPLRPALLRLLDLVLRTGREHGKQVTVCGEIAGDAAMAPILLALGLEHFSLHPSHMLELRRAIRGHDQAALRCAAGKLLKARDRAGIERWLEKVSR
jgi:phosphotransferase system enzyme I (PtsI)